MTRAILILVAAVLSTQAQAEPDTVRIPTHHNYQTLIARIETAIANHKMNLVARASASQGAEARGITIPGNAVLMVFRNDFAVRMLNASIQAGIEAPIRLYVTETPDHTATLSYRTPSQVFAPYGSPPLNELARELDPIFADIAREATAP